jgi:hypothetical protein
MIHGASVESAIPYQKTKNASQAMQKKTRNRITTVNHFRVITVPLAPSSIVIPAGNGTVSRLMTGSFLAAPGRVITVRQ